MCVEPIFLAKFLQACLLQVTTRPDHVVAQLANVINVGASIGMNILDQEIRAMKYIDSIGVKAFVELCDKYKDLGGLYEPTAKLREMAANGESFYQ